LSRSATSKVQRLGCRNFSNTGHPIVVLIQRELIRVPRRSKEEVPLELIESTKSRSPHEAGQNAGGYHEGATVHRSSSCFAVSDILSQISLCLLAGSSGVNFTD